MPTVELFLCGGILGGVVVIIRTGILCVPQQDDEAVAGVMGLLQSTLSGILLLQSTSALSQRHWIEEILRRWCDEDELDLVLTIGSTFPAPGTSPLEIVPDATAAVIDRSLPGLAEAMRTYAAQESSLAWLDRSLVGIRGRSLIVNLPAEAAPAVLFLEAIVDLLEVASSFLRDESPSIKLSDHLEVQPLSPSQTGVSMPSESKQQHGLDADEFAAFLRRRQ